MNKQLEYKQPVLPEFYEDCAKITKAYEKLCGRWHVDSQCLHIITEVVELKDVIRNKNNKYGKYGSSEHLLKLEDELADIFLTAFATANYLGMNIEQLNSALLKKMIEVEARVNKLRTEAEAFANNAITESIGVRHDDNYPHEDT